MQEDIVRLDYKKAKALRGIVRLDYEKEKALLKGGTVRLEYKKEKALLNCKNKIRFIRALRLVSGASLYESFAIMNEMGEEILKRERSNKNRPKQYILTEE